MVVLSLLSRVSTWLFTITQVLLDNSLTLSGKSLDDNQYTVTTTDSLHIQLPRPYSAPTGYDQHTNATAAFTTIKQSQHALLAAKLTRLQVVEVKYAASFHSIQVPPSPPPPPSPYPVPTAPPGPSFEWVADDTLFAAYRLTAEEYQSIQANLSARTSATQTDLGKCLASAIAHLSDSGSGAHAHYDDNFGPYTC